MPRGDYIYGNPRNCVICGISFRPRDRKSNQACCSNLCRGKLQTKRAMRICKICGIEFLPSRAKYATCSTQCGLVYRKSIKINDPMVAVRRKLAVFCCSLISRCLREKNDRTKIMLGYTVKELKSHLESKFITGMTWENYGKQRNQWSIDHKRPISTFPTDADVSVINALSNLQPMWHVENCTKRNKWEGQ